jgi:hypothetical protein
MFCNEIEKPYKQCLNAKPVRYMVICNKHNVRVDNLKDSCICCEDFVTFDNRGKKEYPNRKNYTGGIR